MSNTLWCVYCEGSHFGHPDAHRTVLFDSAASFDQIPYPVALEDLSASQFAIDSADTQPGIDQKHKVTDGDITAK